MVSPSNSFQIGVGSRASAGTLIPAYPGGTGVIDTGLVDWMAIHLGGTFVAQVQVQGSFDGTNWFALPCVTNGGGVSTTLTAGGMYVVQTFAPYTRLQVTSWTSGTVQLFGGGTDVSNGGPIVGTIGGSVTNTPATATPYNATTTATAWGASIKGSAGTLFEIDVTNLTASPVYLKLFDKASAAVPGTDLNPVAVLGPIAANSDRVISFAGTGKRFPTGIAYALTGAQAVADTTALAAACLVSASYI